MTDDTRDEFEAEPVEEPVDEPVDEPVPDDDVQAEAIGEALAELSLDEQLEATRTERDENHQKWQRSLADLENFRRRAHREMDEARTFQALPLARDLMPGLDNLQRAIQAAESNEAAADLVAGVRMVVEQIVGVLARHGVEPITSIGEAFDPAVHEAIQQVPSDDHEPMTVIEEVEQGFRLGDRVVRPAKVIVSMASPVAEVETTGEETPGEETTGEETTGEEN